MKIKPPCIEIVPWLHANLGKNCTGPLTGTDARALAAAVHILELYSYDRQPTVLEAFRLTVERMQPSTRELAYHSIAMVMDWSDRQTLWLQAGFNQLSPRKCAFES